MADVFEPLSEFTKRKRKEPNKFVDYELSKEISDDSDNANEDHFDRKYEVFNVGSKNHDIAVVLQEKASKNTSDEIIDVGSDEQCFVKDNDNDNVSDKCVKLGIDDEEIEEKPETLKKKAKVKTKKKAKVKCKSMSVVIKSKKQETKIDRSVLCEICGKTYKNRTTLSKHKLKHAGVKFPCKLCGELFSDESSATRHEKRHTKSQQYVCDVCGKQFYDVSNFYQHKRLHGGKKEFQCKECNSSFFRRDHLKVHMAKHTGARPYKCHICERTFTQSSPRLAHMQNIHKIKYNQKKGTGSCCICSMVLASLEEAVKHVAEVHKHVPKKYENEFATENLVFQLIEVNKEDEDDENGQQILIFDESETNVVVVLNEGEQVLMEK